MGIIIALDYRRDATLFTAASLYKDPKRSFSEQELSQFQVESDLSAILNLAPCRERTVGLLVAEGRAAIGWPAQTEMPSVNRQQMRGDRMHLHRLHRTADR